jgi:hypothetical protein
MTSTRLPMDQSQKTGGEERGNGRSLDSSTVHAN